MPNIGCLIFLLLLATVGGAPLLVGIARVGLFFFVTIALLGTFAVWRAQRRAVPLGAQDGNARHDGFVRLMVTLLVRLAEADGSLDRREVTVIRHFFQNDLRYTDEKLLWVKGLIQEARNSEVSVAELCERLVQDYDLQARFLVVEMLGRVAKADGVMSAAETRLFEEIVQRLGLAPFVHSFGNFGSFGGGSFGGRQGFGQGQPGPAPDRTAEALSTLGLTASASPADIKKAWRDLSKEHHPDRVTHLGEEFRRVAEERMRRINAAYDILKNAGLA